MITIEIVWWERSLEIIWGWFVLIFWGKRGSFFYVNTLNERGYYNLVIVKRVGFLNHEQITVYVPRFKISDDAKDLNQLKIFDFVGAPSLDYYNDSIDYVLENVTVNQLSVLKNSSNKYNVERLKWFYYF